MSEWLDRRLRLVAVGAAILYLVCIWEFSKLRALNVAQLRALDKTLVIQDNDEPLAVLLKYDQFLAMQGRMPDEE